MNLLKPILYLFKFTIKILKIDNEKHETETPIVPINNKTLLPAFSIVNMQTKVITTCKIPSIIVPISDHNRLSSAFSNICVE